jgi:hypothetical protein
MQFDEHLVQWHFEVWKWLLRNFGGYEQFAKQPLITPTPEFFPFRPRLEHAYFEEVFAAVKSHAGLGEWPCRLEPLEEEHEQQQLLRRHSQAEWQTNGAAGTFEWQGEEVVIRYAPSQASNPTALVATLVHELMHYLLSSAETDPPGGWEEHEFHTDLACSFAGFGIFMANSAFSFQQWSDGVSGGWQTSRKGYLSESEHAFGLALFTTLSGGNPEEVLPFLKPNPHRHYCNALEELAHRQSDIAALRRILPRMPGAKEEPAPSLSRLPRKDPTLSDLKLTPSELEQLKCRDHTQEPPWNFYVSLVEEEPGEAWAARELAALKKLPPELRDLLLAIRLDVLQEREGLQGALLLEGDDSLTLSEEMLRLTADAFERFGDSGRSRFLSALVPCLRQHVEQLEQAVAKDCLDEFFSPLDRDDAWTGLGNDYHHAMRREVQWRPHKFVYPPASQ